ncbi:hypothetical protein GDO78_005949 [Eleutherodactylus coqui]|uniref:Uncharacterized protein n=1 Tax=Eleutherodactylus coqui TaxID=57060 RepID=A0A8J6KIJ0_ELECQ|nr:hypothetical protein GDO78_005949 [Eleutherodactylus coqui]
MRGQNTPSMASITKRHMVHKRAQFLRYPVVAQYTYVLNKPQRVHETKPNKTATKEIAADCAITTAVNSQAVPRQWEHVRRNIVSRTTWQLSRQSP